MNQEFFMYRGYPLVRSGNQIYYGYMSEPYVVMMQILHQQTDEKGLQIADKIKVYQISTKEADPIKAVVRTSDRPSLYEAVDLANVWLRRTEVDHQKKNTAKK